ncbi:MarR family transcriptional regulator [Oxyplasma meridianum]|uniref:MarR family transcriptional regulator n=1 Tax=Oxyplasma meridianum TaxID=3073602 RepID=A0AAX4NFY2_9ARCH
MSEERVISSLKNLAYEIMAYREKQLKTENISFSGMFLISYIAKRGPQKLTDLAVRINQTKSSITYIVSALERKGFLKREYDENDRRVIWVTATERARGLFSFYDEFERTIMSSLSKIDPSKQEAACEVIDRIAESINRERTRED